MKIKNRKQVIVNSGKLVAGTSFDIYYNINNITFRPDEVRINCAFMKDAVDNNCYILHSALVNNVDGLCLIQDSANSLQKYDITYPIHSAVQGEYRFWVQEIDGSIFACANNDAYFYVQLEFIEYHKE